MDALVKLALAGTARRTGVEIVVGAPLDALLAGLPAEDAERTILLAAGAWAVYQQAGWVAPRGESLPESAPVESRPVCSPGAARILADLFAGRHDELLSEALDRLGRAGQRLPAELLPTALNARSRELRTTLLPVLGERGGWLSRFNPEWHWVSQARIETADESAGLERIWQEGTPAERLAVLRRTRSHDPARAREWLRDVWRQEKAEFRIEAIQTLDTSLSLDDETFLESALDDRAAGVRSAAAAPLARLPGSALAGRMRLRADALLTYAPGGSRGGGLGIGRLFRAGDSTAPGKLTVTPPAALDREWQRDGVDLKPPPGVGERAWWLIQTLSVVPLTHWEERFDARPIELIDAIGRDQWRAAVLEGWSRAAVLHRATTWTGPLWEAWYGADGADPKAVNRPIPELYRTLLGRVPQPAAEGLVAKILADAGSALGVRGADALLALPAPWSADFARTYLAALRRHVRGLRPAAPQPTTGDWPRTLPAAARSLPAECFEQALAPWPLPDPVEWNLQRWHRQIEAFTEVIQTRRELHQEIAL